MGGGTDGILYTEDQLRRQPERVQRRAQRRRQSVAQHELDEPRRSVESRQPYRLPSSQLTSFLLRYQGGGGVLFCLLCASLFDCASNLAVPATEHFADFVYGERDGRVFFIVQ